MSVLLQIAETLMAEDMRNPDFQPPFSTLTVGLMKGGTAANILAAEASFIFDLRSLPEHDPEEVLRPFRLEIDAIRDAHPAATIVFEPQAAVPPLARVVGSKAEDVVRRIGGDNSDMLAASFGAEAGQFQQAGFSTVICGPGSIDQAHQADEFIDISEIEKCMQFMDKLFAAMCRPAVIA
jgi:acetylornithine deacetylase